MTHRCAVIGNPIAHSQSPAIHAGFARATGIDLQYDRILGEANTFTQIVHQFFADGGRGMNVTVPFKIAALEMADRVETYAQHAGAANTLWIDANDRLCADNTDGRGLVNALLNAGVTLNNKRLLLVGAGGAAQGVYLPLQEAGAACIDIANRTVSKAETILEQHHSNDRAYPLDASITTPYDLIINATSTGLDGSTLTLPSGIIKAEHTVCYDMVYGKITPFMQWAEQQQADRVLDGHSMLIEQARLSFQRWFGILPPVPDSENKHG